MSEATTEPVRYGVDGGVATITLDRPDTMNALTVAMKEALRDAVERAAAEAAVRAVVLTGSGRAFSAGQDLREHAGNLAAGRGLDGTLRKHYNPIVEAITGMPKPVVAAVNGTAVGAGMSLALACDLVVASEKASFATAFSKIGLGPDSGLSWTLQRLAGRAKAAELLMLAEPLRAPDALALGLVNRVVPAEEVLSAATEIARTLASGPTVAYAAIKTALAHAAAHDLPSALDREAELQDALAETADHNNATEAFLKKQNPTYEGR
ncbi:enoyl-CoA hydratase-related protein [Actinomadura rupiterrae]|uniref:enoyl-CoA hydratase-related protein n=1 Tax=Actinomadura rupiterrae TaxID=559627 RepID=UPI0020A530EF|nr:enoyl-CoA hydratase-related protein [Actinomadura rupiterrae]MCP2336534.1 2-(1,2-epoxy-1,2-dihydrophenyl)acetyl-CoA isomerase [Actinomadura rupiterrae]